MRMYLRILGYLAPYKGLFLLSIGAMVAFGALDAFSLTLLIPFLDVLFQESGSGLATGGDGGIHRLLQLTVGGLIPPDAPMVGLRNVVLVMFVVFLFKNIAAYVEAYTVVLIEQRVTRDMRNQIFDHVLRLDLPFFQRTRTGQVISRLTHDVEQLRTLVTKNLAKALSCAIQVLFMLVILFSLSWKLTLIMLLAIPLMMGMWDAFRKRLHRGVLRVLDAVGELSAHIQERVAGIRLVKTSGAEPIEKEAFESLTHAHYKAVIRNERWRQFFPPATEMITAGAVLLLLWYGSRLVLVDAQLGASSFMAFLALAMRIMSPLKWLGHFPSIIQPGVGAAERAFELLDTPPQVADRPDARPVTSFRESVRFEDVGFEYVQGEPVLDGIDAELRSGEVVALVGPSGGGKTTLASLVPRLHDPTRGRIMLDGVDLRDLRLADLRRLTGVVSQETILFHDTVLANVAYGVEDATRGAVEAAARAAYAHDFIMQLPAGYQTVLGERGTRLSGGQRQRLAIARALLRDPPMLILDEATSALDSESELLVRQAVDQVLRGRTVLVIAHRLSTVRRADRILVLDRGRIVERGSHAELMEQDGLYRHLYRLQFSAEDEAALTVPAGGGQ